jgi:hypothetical protein
MSSFLLHFCIGKNYASAGIRAEKAIGASSNKRDRLLTSFFSALRFPVAHIIKVRRENADNIENELCLLRKL